MNRISVILIALLFAAVAGLYVLYFTGSGTDKHEKPVIGTKKDTNLTADRSLRLAYIDLDTIQEHYLYFKKKKDDLESEKKRMEAEVESAFKKLDQDRVNFLKRGESITQVEAENFQKELYTRSQQLSEKRDRLMNAHMTNQAQAFDQIQGKINEYLKEYNQKAGYHFIFSVGAGNLSVYYKDSTLNITKEVLDGLNETYRKEGKK